MISREQLNQPFGSINDFNRTKTLVVTTRKLSNFIFKRFLYPPLPLARNDLYLKVLQALTGSKALRAARSPPTTVRQYWVAWCGGHRWLPKTFGLYFISVAEPLSVDSRNFVAYQNFPVADFLCGWFVVRQCIADIGGRELCCVVCKWVSFLFFSFTYLG